MPLHFAVILIDHHSAKIAQFGQDQVVESTVKEHLHLHAPRQTNERSQHEYYGHVCDALEGIKQVLVTGGHTSLADFRHYVEKHRPHTAIQLVAFQVVDHPSDNELVALGRSYFRLHDQMMDGALK